VGRGEARDDYYLYGIYEHRFPRLGRVSYFVYLCPYYQMRVYMILRAPGLEHAYDTRLLSIILLHPADVKGVILHNLPVSSSFPARNVSNDIE